MSVARLSLPNLGKPEYRIDPRVEGGWTANAAAVLEMAESEPDNPKARAFRIAFRRSWRKTEGSSLTKAQRERQAVTAGLNAAAEASPKP